MFKLQQISKVLVSVLLVSSAYCASAQVSSFQEGTAIKGFGKYAPIASHTVSKTDVFKIAFDVGQAAKAGEINRKFDSLARFINMHISSGVAQENIHLALVVHGKASFDLTDHATYQKLNKLDNANKALIQALLANNVRVILCGQTAAAYEIDSKQLISGTEVELSAMTAHALLQQQGYTVNPF